MNLYAKIEVFFQYLLDFKSYINGSMRWHTWEVQRIVIKVFLKYFSKHCHALWPWAVHFIFFPVQFQPTFHDLYNLVVDLSNSKLTQKAMKKCIFIAFWVTTKNYKRNRSELVLHTERLTFKRSAPNIYMYSSVRNKRPVCNKTLW